MKIRHLLSLSALLLPALSQANGEDLLAQYRAAGAATFDAERGRQAWLAEVTSGKGDARSCASCHGNNPMQGGRHVRTRKAIKPMAPAVDAARLSDPKKAEKWFLRNCKWTWGRTCSAQEKGDIITYLNGL